MNFTREPIIETIITPKEGYKLVIRNSKVGGQEEFFVESVELISFGYSSFYRSVEKPKSFLVPVSDYEILEVRETRVVLKTPHIEKVKIGVKKEEEETTLPDQEPKKRERKRRKRKMKTEKDEEPKAASAENVTQERDRPAITKVEKRVLIPPPATLISESISQYRETSHFEKPPTSETFKVQEFESEEAKDYPEEEEEKDLFLEGNYFEDEPTEYHPD